LPLPPPPPPHVNPEKHRHPETPRPPALPPLPAGTPRALVRGWGCPRGGRVGPYPSHYSPRAPPLTTTQYKGRV